MFGQILAMNNFAKAAGVTGIQNPTISGFLTSILELGAWVGVLINGILADALGTYAFFFLPGRCSPRDVMLFPLAPSVFGLRLCVNEDWRSRVSYFPDQVGNFASWSPVVSSRSA